MPAGVNCSRDLRWMLTKECSTHMVKVRNYPKAFSKDPLNPKGLHLPRFSGCVQTKAVTVRPGKRNQGVTLIYKKKSAVCKPSDQLVRVPLKKDPRKTLTSIKNTLNSMKGYRKDLKMLALRRASALLKSQKTKQKKKRKQTKRGKAAKK
ncbi:60S ribosomal protein L28, partial [Fragariocoptes setiger]